MLKTVIKYGLRLKGKENILQYSMTSMDPGIEFSVPIQYELTESGDGDWLIDTEDEAIYAMYNPSKNYSASYDLPEHYYKPTQLEIVKVEQIITETPIEYKIVNIILKKEYVLSGDPIPYYNSDSDYYFDTFYIANEVITAIDRDNYYQILKIQKLDLSYNIKFDKKYFNIIED